MMTHLLLATLCCATGADAPELSVVVYRAKEGKYAVIRTPQLLVTKAGTLLAFAQGRSSSHDRSDNDIILKRSADGGKTWSPIEVIADHGKDALNSICVVELRESGRILVVGCQLPDGYEIREFQYLSPALQEYQRKAGHDKFPSVKPGYDGNDIVRNYAIHSDDDGQTWSPLRDITRQVKHAPPSLWCVPGPGNAIQLHGGPHAGRIVVPCNTLWLDKSATPPVYRFMPYAIFSDDGGETWQRGEPAPAGTSVGEHHGDEVQIVELPGGGLMLNTRSVERNVATSTDGGKTWSPLKTDPSLQSTPTAAGFIRYSGLEGGRSRLIFSNPSEVGRNRGVIALSYDDGKTWPVQKVLRPGRFKYSHLARLPDGQVGCIFDGTVDDGEIEGESRGGAVILARFSLAWLTDGTDDGR
jgi:sialidase-1